MWPLQGSRCGWSWVAAAVAGATMTGWSVLDAGRPSVGPSPGPARLEPWTGADGRGAVACAPGLTEPAGQVVELRASRPGRLTEVRVASGAAVTAGDVLAVLDHDEVDARVALREAELAGAEARLAWLEAGARREEVDAARAALAAAGAGEAEAGVRVRELEAGARAEEVEAARARLAEADALRRDAARTVERRRGLVPSGAIGAAQVDEAQTALEAAEARDRLARADLALLEAGARRERRDAAREEARAAGARRDQAAAQLALLEAGARPEEIAEARARRDAACATLASARAEREDSFVRAPLSGVVVYRHAHPGEQAGPADPRPLLEVAATRPLLVRADVDEFDVARVRAGQAAWVTAPAFGDARFPGRVVLVERTMGRKNFRTDHATERKDAKVLEVLVALDEPASERIPLGMPVRVWFAEE